MGVVSRACLCCCSVCRQAQQAPPASNAKPKSRRAREPEGTDSSLRQDAEAIAWIGLSYKVHVRSLLLGASAVVGSAAPVAGTPQPAFARRHAAVWRVPRATAWSTFRRPRSGRAEAYDLFMGGNGDPGGIFQGGVPGRSEASLGKREERCDNPGGVDCKRLDVTGGGVIFVTGQFEQSSVSTIPAPVMLAFAGHDPQSGQISQGMVAVAPAESPLLSDLGDAPRVAENGSVQVYRFLNKPVLVSSVAPRERSRRSRSASRSWPCSFREPTGRGGRAERRQGAAPLLGTTVVPKATASEL